MSDTTAQICKSQLACQGWACHDLTLLARVVTPVLYKLMPPAVANEGVVV
jgi:hypothetical protein